MTKVARSIGSGATLIILGLIMTVGWYLSHLSITHTITNDQIRDALVIDSVDSKGYSFYSFFLYSF